MKEKDFENVLRGFEGKIVYICSRPEMLLDKQFSIQQNGRLLLTGM